MTDKEINIKIAKACDWTQTPDCCNDLNAMHEAEQTLNIVQQGQMVRRLHCLGSRWGLIATARQRAEAFLRIFNLWEE